MQLNPLRLAQICVEISKHVSDPNNAITFLDTVQKKIQETKGRRDERNFVQVSGS